MNDTRPGATQDALSIPEASALAGYTDAELLDFYTRHGGYRARFEDKHRFTDRFLARYHESLFYYRHFYDDYAAVGDPERCREAFYFIPGYNGTPGQMRFGLPSLYQKFGRDIYLRGLYLDEFSSRRPSWMKYSAANLALRRRRIVDDLNEMSRRFRRLRIIVSSTGFYYLLAVWPEIESGDCEHILYWVSCAPDRVSPSRAERLFYPLNGFTWEGRKWFAYPNQQALRFINPECSTIKRWRHHRQARTFFKNDLESRFRCAGLSWDFASPDCITFALEDNLQCFRRHGRKLEMKTHVLAAIRDGFWDDSSPAVIEATMDRYLARKRIIFKETSHLWVVTPENIAELIG